MRPRPDLTFEAGEQVLGPRDVQRLHVILKARGGCAGACSSAKRMPDTNRQVHLEPGRERLDLLRDLHLDPREHPFDPAIDGSWR